MWLLHVPEALLRSWRTLKQQYGSVSCNSTPVMLEKALALVSRCFWSQTAKNPTTCKLAKADHRTLRCGIASSGAATVVVNARSDNGPDRYLIHYQSYCVLATFHQVSCCIDMLIGHHILTRSHVSWTLSWPSRVVQTLRSQIHNEFQNARFIDPTQPKTVNPPQSAPQSARAVVPISCSWRTNSKKK